MTRISPASLALSFALAAAAAAEAAPLFPQDTIVVQKISSNRKALEGERQYLLSGNTMKVRDITATDSKEVIIDFAAKKVVELDPKAKTFREVAFEDLEKRFQQGWDGFHKLPTDEQNKLRAQAAALPPTRVDRTDEFATIAGFKARKYEVTIIDQKQELWASPEFNFPNEYYEYEIMKSPMVGPRGEAVRQKLRELQAVEGFALKKVVQLGRPEDKYTVTTDTTEVRRKIQIPAVEFQIPKGFTKAPAKSAAITATPAAMSVPVR